jgi:hypothetical protein
MLGLPVLRTVVSRARFGRAAECVSGRADDAGWKAAFFFFGLHHSLHAAISARRYSNTGICHSVSFMVSGTAEFPKLCRQLAWNHLGAFLESRAWSIAHTVEFRMDRLHDQSNS